MTGSRPPRAAVVIPARYASSRFPGKPLVALKGATGVAKPLVQRAWEAASRVEGVARVVVATDDDRIAQAATAFGADVVMTSPDCANGTERCAEAMHALGADFDVIVNLQGDAPLTPAAYVRDLIALFAGPRAPQVATPAIRCSTELLDRLLTDQAAGRVGGTTVAVDGAGRAMYFSKRVIPYIPETMRNRPGLPVFFHVGLYAYTPAALASYRRMEPTEVEQLEGLEQLRFLHGGVPVQVLEVEQPAWGIWELNNPADVPIVEAELLRAGMA